MDTKRQGFTLIEIVVVLGITISLFVIVGGVMTSSFRLKSNGETAENVQNESQIIMGELKKNILDADPNLINCTAGVGNSISFASKNGGNTTLYCDANLAKIASISAQSGTFYLNKDNLPVANCDNFVSCDFDGGQNVTNVNFNLQIGATTESGNNQFWSFESKVVPR